MRALFFFIFCSIVNIFFSDYACTGIRLISSDGEVIYARTFEWRESLNSHIIFMPRNVKHIGTSINGIDGMEWYNPYAFTGITIGKRPFLIDGVNEKGLSAGLFSFWDDIEYNLPDNDCDCHIAPWEVVNYILSCCATVHDVYKCLDDIKIVPVYMEEVDEIPPLHYVVHDVQGNCIVLEHVNHTIKIYENSLGVITNSPNFEWHLTNISTYINPFITFYKTIAHFDSKKINFDHALGLPGDFSSPSRFIKATIYSQCSLPSSTGFNAILQAFHILNQFDIPVGAVRSMEKNFFTYTHWTSAANLAQKKYYFRTYENQRIRVIDLMHMNFDNKKPTWMCMNQKEDLDNVTDKIIDECNKDC